MATFVQISKNPSVQEIISLSLACRFPVWTDLYHRTQFIIPVSSSGTCTVMGGIILPQIEKKQFVQIGDNNIIK